MAPKWSLTRCCCFDRDLVVILPKTLVPMIIYNENLSNPAVLHKLVEVLPNLILVIILLGPVLRFLGGVQGCSTHAGYRPVYEG